MNSASTRRRVAVLGASTQPSKFGYKAVQAFSRAGHEVYPVNPRAEEVAGIPCFPDLDSLPVAPDIVSAYLPPALLLEVLPDIAQIEGVELWLNPGTDTPEVLASARDLGLPITQTCSIIAMGFSPSELGEV